MPNRIVKESIRTSKKVNSMTDFQFRLWLYLITYVDDYGRGSADPELLKGFVFPRRKRVTESDIYKALAELAGMGCINLYEIDGESYFYFPNWGDHQRIQTKRSKFPEPPTEENDNQRYPTVIHGDSPPESKSESKSNNNMSCKPDNVPAYADIINYLNAKAGTAFKHTTKTTQAHIKARYSEGFSFDDFKAVIDKKVSDWLNNPDMSQYLRPQTLFGTKFESYLQTAEKDNLGSRDCVNQEIINYKLEQIEKEMAGG